MKRTRFGDLMPDNPNPLRRPPREMPLDILREFASLPPGGVDAAIREGIIPPWGAAELMADLRQFRRAQEQERALPGDYMGDDRLPYLSMPFAPLETHRPDRLPGTEAHDLTRRILENKDVHDMTVALQRKMAESTPPLTSGPTEPSLREHISAAVDALSSNPQE